MLLKFSNSKWLYAFIYETNHSKSGVGLPSIVALAQGDISETSNEPTQAIRSEFEELYASANKELYPSYDYVTRLDFMVKFTYFKVKGKLTDSIFNEMLEFFRKVFPTTKGYKLPSSYYAIKKTFKMTRLGYESIHACVNDCFLFRGEDYKDKQFCPVYNTSRWKDSNTPGKKVPKVLRYFSIILRLQHLYKSSHTAKEMTWHATRKCTEPSKMQHPIDGRAWKNFDTKYSNFPKEPRNVRLGLAADGFNPFSNLSQSYSMEIVREFLMHFGSWRSIPPEWKAGVLEKIGPHMQPELWPDIRNGIDQHLGKIYTNNKSSLKKDYWVKNPNDDTYYVEDIRSDVPRTSLWKIGMRRSGFGLIPRTWPGMKTSATREYPSLIHTFFLTHTVNGVFLNPEDKALYGLGSNTPTGVPYTEDEIMAIVCEGKQRGHIPGVRRVLPGQGTLESQPEYDGGSGSDGCGDDKLEDDEDGGEDEEDEDDS
nr:hypothetical protein [Tanacetum cinerariifolium]